MTYAIQTLEIERSEILKRIRAISPVDMMHSSRLADELKENLHQIENAIASLTTGCTIPKSALDVNSNYKNFMFNDDYTGNYDYTGRNYMERPLSIPRVVNTDIDKDMD